jgi:hypothetical protein
LSKAFETRLNVLLARLLSTEFGLRAMSEHISHRDRPDMLIYVNGIKVILEGSYSRQDAENDIRRRINEGFGDIGVALYYKRKFPTNLTDAELEVELRKSIFEIRLIVPQDISNTLLTYLTNKKIASKWITDWMDAKVTDLVQILNEAIQFIISEEDVIQIINNIEQKINDFVESVKSVDQNGHIAKNLYEIFYKLYGLSVGDYTKINELIYAKAALTIFLSITFYESIRTQLRLGSMGSLCKQYGTNLGIRKGYEYILKVDYRPIYNLAIQVTESLPPNVNTTLEKIVKLAEECASKRTILMKDFSGKIYHKIVGDWATRKGFATFFTTVPAAYLLAYLAVFTKSGVFANFKDFKVGDLTCGSGTLLIAAYNAIKDLYIYSKFGNDEINLKSFHKSMLEECIWGFDALRYAVQITSTNLALQDPITQVSHMNTYTIPLGKDNGKVTLGSLEFIKGRSIPTIAMWFEGATQKFIEGAQATSITGNEEVPEEIPKFDLLIMNPPFTRATGRGGKEQAGLFGFIIDPKVRKDVLNAYEDIRDLIKEKLRCLTYPEINLDKELNEQYSILSKLDIKELYNIGQAGEGLLFLYLASGLINNGGKIAFVLPKSFLTGISWFLVRNLLLRKFHLEHIVVSYDAKNGYNFSESTSLSETLIVARKREPNGENEETTITILHRKPMTSLEARALAFKIVSLKNDNYLEVNGSKAYVYRIPRQKLIKNLFNWGSLLAFPDPKLTKIAEGVLDGNIFTTKIPMIRLGEIAKIGIDRHQFNDVFKIVSEGTLGSYPAVYGGEEKIRLQMLVEPNACVVPNGKKTYKESRPGEKLFNEFSSRLLVPERIWVDTAHIIALYTTEPVLSNIFYALRLKNGKDEDREKALCLWLNTTWGVLSLLANRSETRGRWISLNMTHWRLQPVLDVTRLDEEKIKELAEVFDKYSNKCLQRLPDQFNPDNIDLVRKDIDKNFLEVLNIGYDKTKINELYKLIYQNLDKWINE